MIGIILILFLISCSEEPEIDVFEDIETADAYQTPTGSVIVETIEEPQVTTIPKTTAKDVIKDMGAMMQINPNNLVFEGNFYPRIQTTKKGEDALKEKTRALHRQEIKLPTEVDADRSFGPRIYTPDKIRDLEEADEN